MYANALLLMLNARETIRDPGPPNSSISFAVPASYNFAESEGDTSTGIESESRPARYSTCDTHRVSARDVSQDCDKSHEESEDKYADR